jgi:hypothetical protein
MRKLIMTAAVLTVLAWTAQAYADQVTLKIEGVHSDDDGIAITNALRQLPTAKVASKPTQKNPTTVVAFDLQKLDVGDLAVAVAGTKTPNQAKGAPSATLVLNYKRNDRNALADEVVLPNIVEPVLPKLRGVDAKQCKVDTKAKQLHIKLDDKGGAKLADIKAAFPGLELE